MADKGKERATALVARLESREALIGVIGLGYVGLPLVETFVQAGFPVLGFDIDPVKVESLERGESYIGHIPHRVVEEMTGSGRFQATADFDRLGEPDCLLICVPTPLTRSWNPDMSYVESTTREIAARLRPGQLVILESTTYPGTSREVLLPILEESGLEAGRDFFLAFSPEREDPGRKSHTTRTIPKVVGGLEENSLACAQACYAGALDRVVPVSSCEAAEASKILENTFRAVNIALVNELKILLDRMGIDIWEVIRASSTKPFGFMPFYPGPGLGGHCIPIDPFYLAWKARQHDLTTRFIELAGQVNISMPEFVVGKVVAALNDRGKAVKGARILILGLAYKKNIGDVRESPSLKLIELLQGMGAAVDYNDPHVPRTHRMRHYDFDMVSRELSPEMLAGYDLVLISTDHDAYDYQAILDQARLVVDTRNATEGLRCAPGKVIKA